MCGRLTLKTAPELWGQMLLPLIETPNLPDNFQPRYNIAPTQTIQAVAVNAMGQNRLSEFRWGLIPAWASDLSIGNSMINARHETLQEKRSFRGPLEKRRCLIIADGYYEWRTAPKQSEQSKQAKQTKQPFWIAPAAGGLICLAGLWETNSKATGQLINSCTIITTAANQQLAEIHDRMPVVMDGRSAQLWLAPQTSLEQAYKLLGPAEEGFFHPVPVSNFVNNARNDGIKCIARLPLS